MTPDPLAAGLDKESQVPLRQIFTAAVLVIGASLIGTSTASAENVDLAITGEVVSRDGDERVVEFTMINRGPEALVVTKEIGIQLTVQGAAEIVSVNPCGYFDATGFPATMRFCGFGKTLGVGASVSLEATVRVTGPGVAQITGYETWGDGGDESIYNPATDAPQDSHLDPPAYVRLDGKPGCELQAKGPQKASKALVVTVDGATSGCEAKLKSVKFKVGSKVYTFIKKHVSKNVAAGEKWKVSVPLQGQAMKAVKKALADKKPVKAAAEFDLDGKSESIVVKIK